MNNIEALEGAYVLWSWLVDNPGQPKYRCPDVPVSGWVSSCPLCEYLSGQNSCYSCLMYGRWPSEEGVSTDCGFGAYGRWEGLMKSRRFTDNTYDLAFFALILMEAFEDCLSETEIVFVEEEGF